MTAPVKKQRTTRKGTMYILIYLAATALFLYAGICLLTFVFQRTLIFPATRTLDRDPGHFGWVYEDILLPVNGETTHGWYIPLENARGTALFSHGNAGNIADRLESISLLRSMGFSVLAYDYGGYGRSTGKPSEQRCYADIQAFWDYLLHDRGIPPEKILLFGRSLGGGATADLAARVQPAAVVLESTFLSIPDVVRDIFPFLPIRWCIRHHFKNKDKVGDIQAPLLIIHSPDDRVIPFRHGKELFDLATEPRQFLEIRGDHNEGFVLSMDIYRAGWDAFLAPMLPK